MTLSEFVDQYKHKLHGMIADAAVRPAKGGELSIRLCQAFNEVEQILTSAYFVARGEKEPPKPVPTPPRPAAPPQQAPPQQAPPQQRPPQAAPPGAKR